MEITMTINEQNCQEAGGERLRDLTPAKPFRPLPASWDGRSKNAERN